VDVFLLPLEEGAHGTVSAEVSSNLKVTPFAEFRYGSERTDILTNASYNYRHDRTKVDSRYEYEPAHEQFSNFHMKNTFSEKDQLVTYFTQSYTQTLVHDNFLSSNYRYDDRFFSGQLRNYHFWTPQTSLMSAVVYQNGVYPVKVFDKNPPHAIQNRSKENLQVFAAVEELNTTFFDALNLMAGIEVDYVMGDEKEDIPATNRTDTLYVANSLNTDAYVELDYTFKQWRFTLGDRVRYYRYQVEKQYMGIEVQHRCQNLAHASVVFTPHRQHQIQLAYARKYRSPEYIQLLFDETPFNEVKLAYTFSRPNVTASLNTYFDNQKTPDGITTNWLRVDASAYYRIKFFTVTGGIATHATLGDAKIYNLAVRVNPVFNLPYQMRVQCRFAYYLDYYIAAREWSRGWLCYDEVQFTKSWGPWGKSNVTLDTYVQWHNDINANFYGVGTLGLRVNI